MTPTEMRRRLKAGEAPLELSIEKWEDILYRHGVDDGGHNCALCQSTTTIWSCDGCVIADGEEGACMRTPYSDWDEHQEDKHPGLVHRVRCPECSRLALFELSFLKSFRGVPDVMEVES